MTDFLYWLYAPCSFQFLLYLAAMINFDFWDSPPGFIQENFHLLGHVSQPIPAPLPSLPLSLPFPLFSKTLAVVPPLFHFPASLPTTFSPCGCQFAPAFSDSRTSFLLWLPPFSASSIQVLNCLLGCSTPPAFRIFNNPDSDQKSRYCTMSNFQLIVARGIFFRSTSKSWANTFLCSQNIVTAASGFPVLGLSHATG